MHIIPVIKNAKEAPAKKHDKRDGLTLLSDVPIEEISPAINAIAVNVPAITPHISEGITTTSENMTSNY